MDDDERRQVLDETLDVWAPGWPRRVTRNQLWAHDAPTAREFLLDSEAREGDSPFISTYSFPRGHTKEGNIPQIDTLFIDFDFDTGDYVSGSGDVAAWRRDLSHLLVRVRMVAQYLRENGRTGLRAALSGHKGVHLFIDFDPLPVAGGEFRQYVNGLNDYATELVDQLADATGLSDLQHYVDVTSSDLGRLCRMPNTQHEGATDSFGEPRYCVPVSVDELCSMTPKQYLEFTQAPRPVPSPREPNDNAHDIILQYVRTANAGNAPSPGGDSTVNWELVDQYKDQQNENITLGDIKFITSERPCVWRFYERDDKYQHGYESHFMEMYCIRELLEKNVPIEVIKEFLDSAPEYNEAYSDNFIKQIISRDYHRFSIETVLRNAPTFSGYDDCAMCQRVIAEQDDL